MSRNLQTSALAALIASSAIVASACTTTGATPEPSASQGLGAIVQPSIAVAVVPPPSANATGTPAPSDSSEPSGPEPSLA